MLERAEELKQRVRETPLNDRLDDARRRIGKMCSEGRPPRMTIPVQYDDDDFYISTTLADAQATIADLQEKIAVERANKESAVACVDRDVKKISALQQRVAQLEGELDEARRKLGKIETRCPSCQNTTLFISDHGALVCSWLGCKNPVPERFIAALQADHARVLGLVRALPLVNGVLGVRVAEVELGNMWAITVDGYFDGNSALFETENEANAYMALLKYRASLPAQPAQGGAKCVWVDDEGGIYQTGCKHAFMVDPDSDEPPIWIKFCCYCGSLVEFFVPAAEGETRA